MDESYGGWKHWQLRQPLKNHMLPWPNLAKRQPRIQAVADASFSAFAHKSSDG
jgi:hypothetical protein